MRIWDSRFVAVILWFGACVRCAAQPVSEAPTFGLPASRPPGYLQGPLVRPADGVRHAELDKAWQLYDAAVDGAIAQARATITERFERAVKDGDLDAAEKWQAISEKFEKQGALPDESEVRSVAEAEKKVRDARAELGSAYESVVKSLTTARDIEAAKATRTEWLSLSTRWDKAAPRRVPFPAARHAARPRGIVTRPKNGVVHPDLDVAWQRYEAAVDNAIEEVQAAIRGQLDAATERGDLDAVEQWQKTRDAFRHVGAMPVEKELKASVNALRRVLREAKEKLSVEYAAVVKSLTTNKDLELAKAVRGEGRPFGRKDIPKDAFTIADHSYYFFTDPKTQAQAQEACEKLGGYLARVNSRSEQDAMNAKLASFRLPGDAVFWVDGSDKQQEGRWWFLDGSPMPGDLQWLPLQPDNANGGEHGLQLMCKKHRYYDRWDVGLNDGLQDGKFGFLCEWDEIKE